MMRFFIMLVGLVGPVMASDLHAPWMGRVLIAEDPAATVAFAPQSEPIRRMVQNGIVAFTGQPTEKVAWLSLVSTNDKIGVKVHASAGSSGTRLAVAESVVKGLLEAGIPGSQIIIWDRRLSDLRQSGYSD